MVIWFTTDKKFFLGVADMLKIDVSVAFFQLFCLLFSLWDAKIEDKIVQDRIGMNLLYVQVNLTDFIIVVKWDGLRVLKSVLRLFKT